jgi:hypothetical protein
LSHTAGTGQSECWRQAKQTPKAQCNPYGAQSISDAHAGRHRLLPQTVPGPQSVLAAHSTQTPPEQICSGPHIELAMHAVARWQIPFTQGPPEGQFVVPMKPNPHSTHRFSTPHTSPAGRGTATFREEQSLDERQNRDGTQAPALQIPSFGQSR